MKIGLGLGVRYPTGITLAQRIAALFVGSQQGAWYDPSDMSTLFQDSAGATPVTAVEQPVGRMLDKSGRNNHASQATAASRPVLSARVNLLTKTEDFASAVWVGLVGGDGLISRTPNYLSAAAPDGTFTACRIQASKTAASFAVLRQQVAVPQGITATPSSWIKSNTGVSQNIVFSNSVVSVGVVTVTTNWTLMAGLPVAAGPTALCYLDVGVGGASDNSVDVLIWHPQLDLGPTAARYQRVNTATDYDTAGFPMYAKTDGVDDSMSSATGGGGSAGFFFCQAIKPAGGAGAVRTLLSDSGTNSGYRVQLNATNQLSFSAGNGTTYTTIATAAATTIGATHLLTVWDDSTNLNVQLDSGTVATVARPVVTAGTAGFTLGKDNGAATGFFNGNLYPEVYRQGSGLTAAERAQVQVYVRSKAGL